MTHQPLPSQAIFSGASLPRSFAISRNCSRAASRSVTKCQGQDPTQNKVSWKVFPSHLLPFSTLADLREARPNVFLRVLGIKLHGTGAVADIEFSFRFLVGSLPLQEHRFRASLTAHETDGL